MVANMISRAAVLLAASASVVSAGSAIIHNQCNFPVYLWSVSNTAGPMQQLAANGGEYTEAYRTNPNGGGISMKLASSEAAPNITQFEYTLTGSDLWYDISNINGYPFEQWGVSVVPSDSSCTQVICPAGIELCAGAYNTPTEDYATAECSSAADIVVLLCSGAQDTNPGSSASSSLSSVVASVTSVAKTATTSSTSTTATSSVLPSLVASSVTSAIVSTTVVPTTVASSTTNDAGVVILTTFATQIITVTAGGETTATATATATSTQDFHHFTFTGRPSFTGFAKRHARHHHGHQN